MWGPNSSTAERLPITLRLAPTLKVRQCKIILAGGKSCDGDHVLQPVSPGDPLFMTEKPSSNLSLHGHANRTLLENAGPHASWALACSLTFCALGRLSTNDIHHVEEEPSPSCPMTGRAFSISFCFDKGLG